MTKEDNIKEIIYLAIFTKAQETQVGNKSLVAANVIANIYKVKDITLICQLAKGIENSLGSTIDDVKFDCINACIELMVSENL